jgi:hypothetical protein
LTVRDSGKNDKAAELQKKGKRGKSPGVRDIWVRGLSAAVL